MLNPKTEEFNSLRFWLTPCLLNVFKNNKHNEFPQNIFDIGTVFKTSSKTETNVEEPTRVGVGIAHHNANYTEIRQALDYVLQQLNLTGKVVEYEHPSFLNGRTGRCIVGGKKVAIIGEIHPQVLKNFDIEVPVSVFELNLTEIFKLIK